MLTATKLDPDRAVLLVIDLQVKLLPLITGVDDLLRASDRLIRGCGVFDLPTVCTVQYPQGLGDTKSRIADVLKERGVSVIEKTAFSCCDADGVRRFLSEHGRRQVIISGIETHVCVQQTTLDLLAMGYEPFVCADAVGSRTPLDYDVALLRMRQAGAVVTTVESVLFELAGVSGTERFKKILEIVK